jgi:pimeloyl-ACP methyl ester carboxylesterase
LDSKPRVFALPAYRLAAVEWGAGSPCLALHGWLDNAGSFNLLAPRLTGCHIVALDAAGHGLSGDRSPDSAYNIWQDLGDLIEVADQLQWARFNLIGHSRGAAVAMLFASAFPERVERLVLIEGGLPIVGQAEDAPENLANALTKSRTLRHKAGRIFPSRAQAIEERANGFSKVNLDAASILAERSLREIEGGWQWHADQRLKSGSEIKLTRELTEAFVRGVQAPVLMCLAEQSPFRDHPVYVEMLDKFSRLELQRLPGGHHFHMEGAEADIARHISAFLASAPSSGS